MLPNSAKVVAELDATLRELHLAQQTKTAAEGHDDTALKGGDDGDSKPKEGERGAEMKADVDKQQELSTQKGEGTAKSPVTGTAASVGTAEDAKSDNKTTKDKADDPGTANSDLSVKTAACLALGDELLKIAGELPEGFAENQFKKKDDDKGEKKDAPAVETAKDDKKDLEAMKKEAAAVDALLPEGADLQKCAGVPDLPSDEAALQKVASDVVATYIQKCAEAYDGDVQKGFSFAANFHAGLAEMEKTAAAADPEVAELVKLAEEDATDVAALMGGMQGGMPGEGGEGEGGGMPLGLAGGEGGEGGGEGEGEGEGDEGAQPEAGGEGGELGGGAPAAGAGVSAEQILAALQAAGIDPSMLAKTASAKGLSERAVLATLATISKKK